MKTKVDVLTGEKPKPNCGHARLDTPEGAAEYFRKRFEQFKRR